MSDEDMAMVLKVVLTCAVTDVHVAESAPIT